MFVDILFGGDQAALRLAFDRACSELGIGTNSDDTVRREQLAKLILSLAREGESEATLIQHKAVWQMQHPNRVSPLRKAGLPVTRPSGPRKSISPHDEVIRQGRSRSLTRSALTARSVG
jgi:hypothetical protein